ncbi:MAG: hypothetical protein ACO3EZ_07810 [Prochlorotrichaceae cyanobacterium]
MRFRIRTEGSKKPDTIANLVVGNLSDRHFRRRFTGVDCMQRLYAADKQTVQRQRPLPAVGLS